MKLLKIAFILFTILFFAFFGFLLSLKSDIKLATELNTEIPVPVAFKQLVLTTTHQPYLTPEALDSVRVSFTYFRDRQPLKVVYRPVVDFKRNRLIFQPVEPPTKIQPFKSIRHFIYLQKLVDGSTNIHWELRYRVAGLTPRLLNYFIWQPRLQQFLNRRSAELKSYFH